MSDKPREFALSNPVNSRIHDGETFEIIADEGDIHVIEYSAYEAAIARAEKAEAELEHLQTNHALTLEQRIKKLRSALVACGNIERTKKMMHEIDIICDQALKADAAAANG